MFPLHYPTLITGDEEVGVHVRHSAMGVSAHREELDDLVGRRTSYRIPGGPGTPDPRGPGRQGTSEGRWGSRRTPVEISFAVTAWTGSSVFCLL